MRLNDSFDDGSNLRMRERNCPSYCSHLQKIVCSKAKPAHSVVSTTNNVIVTSERSIDVETTFKRRYMSAAGWAIK